MTRKDHPPRLSPPEAVQTWLAAAEISAGPVFRPVLTGQRVQVGPLSPFSAAQIVKAYAKRAGLDPVQFAGHSLRSGFLTSAAENGASVFKMMEVSRHRSVDTLRGYGRRADLFHEHAGAGVPLTPKGQPRPLINAGMRRACEVHAGHRLPERPA